MTRVNSIKRIHWVQIKNKFILTEKSRVSDSKHVGEVRGRVGVDEALVGGLGAEGVNPRGVLLEVVLEAQSLRRVY